MSAVPRGVPLDELKNAYALPVAPAIVTPDHVSRSVCPAVPAKTMRALRPGRSRVSESAAPPATNVSPRSDERVMLNPPVAKFEGRTTIPNVPDNGRFARVPLQPPALAGQAKAESSAPSGL